MTWALSEEIKIYGYSSFNFCISTKDRIGLGLPFECQSKGGSFTQALLAPFLEFTPFERAKFLAEIEFKYAPEIEVFGEIKAKKKDGEFETEYEKKGADEVKVEGFGEIDIAYAFFEYEFIDLLSVRFGKYLNPFGLYLESRDASPVYLFILLPSIYRKLPSIGRFIPFYNHGIQLRGEIPYLKYAVQVANGRGSVANAIDVNADKAIGVHVSFQVPSGSFFGSRLGADFYTDKDFENERQTTFAGHLLLSFSGLHFINELAYTEIPNKKAIGGYSLLGYSFPVQSFQITPFLIVDSFAEVEQKATSSLGGGLTLDYNSLRIKSQILNIISGSDAKSSIVLAFGIALAF